MPISMKKRWWNWEKIFSNKDHRLIYAAIFRVTLSILLLIDVIGKLIAGKQLYLISDFVYKQDQVLLFLPYIRENITVFLCLFAGVLVLFLFGIGRSFTSLLVFLFLTVDVWLLDPGLSWGEAILRITMLYFVFVDSFRYFAIQKDAKEPGLFHQLAVYSIMLNVCLIYLINAWHKLHNVEWLDGYAVSYIFNFMHYRDYLEFGSFLEEYPLLVQLISWFVLFFQTTFSFFIWVKRLKWFWILSGILMHIIMAVTLQLYKFELIMILLYGFFVTDEEWKQLFGTIKLKNIHGKR